MVQKLQFTKMHGLGNDFVVVDAISQCLEMEEVPMLSKKLCDRHFGIGADGLILVLPSVENALTMRIFNADGSEPQMCGNGMRCFAKFVYETGRLSQPVFSVSTLAGVMVPTLTIENGQVVDIEVDMGEAILQRSKIPMLGAQTEVVVREALEVDGASYEVTCVSMGNPHCILFVESLVDVACDVLGHKIETHSVFPEKTNVEFVQILNRKEASMLVWERGVGQTLACGTGACAVVVAGVLNGLLDRDATVHLPGGDVKIQWRESDGHVVMTGAAQTVYQGEIHYKRSKDI